jgi:hypothetical protein
MDKIPEEYQGVFDRYVERELEKEQTRRTDDGLGPMQAEDVERFRANLMHGQTLGSLEQMLKEIRSGEFDGARVRTIFTRTPESDLGATLRRGYGDVGRKPQWGDGGRGRT